jgi:hypothetical protein
MFARADALTDEDSPRYMVEAADMKALFVSVDRMGEEEDDLDDREVIPPDLLEEIKRIDGMLHE